MSLESYPLALDAIAHNDPVIHDVAEELGRDLDEIKNLDWFVIEVANVLERDTENLITTMKHSKL